MSIVKNSDATSWHKLVHISTRFAPSFVYLRNIAKWTQTLRKTPKHEFRDQLGGSGAFVLKNSDAASWHELVH